jgi:hypothetical protein
MSHPCKVVLSAVLVGCLAGLASAAPVPTKADTTPAGKARQSLDKKVTLKAENKSLTEVVELLREEAKVEVTLDTPAMQQFGVDVNTPAVNCDLKDAKVRDVMKAVLAKYNLRCGVTADGLVVSTEDGLIARQLRQRVDVDATDRPLGEVLKGLADQTGANVVLDSRPGKKLADAAVTLKADDVPVETAVRLAAEIGGYSVVRMGNVLFVTTTERADKLRPDADKPVAPATPFPVFPTDPLLPPLPGLLPPGGIVPPVVDPPPPPVQEKK